MKYLFINSVAGFGSTGRLAAEKCRELMEQGHQCVIAYGRTATPCGPIPTVRIGTDWDCRLHALQSRLLDNSGFGSRQATRRFLDWVRRYDPDVIWLHNLHGYYIHVGELFAYLRTCGKKILWTLHDCWAFTGHCAYFDYAGCDRWKTGCHHCPEKHTYPQSLLCDGSAENYARKKALFTDIPNLSLIVPSHWLERRVKASFLGQYPVEVVYHQVDRQIFRPTPSDFRREQGLEGKILLLGVASVWDRRKGLEDFLALARLLDERYQIVLIGLNDRQKRDLPPNVLPLPRTATAEQLAQIYSAADIFLNPSMEETFGLTVLEAECCGTPAVVYAGTACQEIVEQFGGLAVPRGPEHLLEAVQALTKERML